MATETGKNRCVTCGKENAVMKCGGCSQDFCFNHMTDHRQELNKQLDEVEVNRDLFRQTLTEQTNDPQKHALIQQINDWECHSIKIIRETAEEARQTLVENTIENITQIEIDLNNLTAELKQSREENDFYEIDLRHWNEELTRLIKELVEPSNIHLRQDTRPFISKIAVDKTSISRCSTKIGANATWVQNAVTVAGGNGQGDELNQLSSPFGLYIDDDQTIYVADYSNHRIMEWKNDATSGQVAAGGKGAGDLSDQLNHPIDVIVDKESDSLIICDRRNKRVVRWPRRDGVSGETIISNVDCWGLTMDNDGYLYVSDYSKHEVRRWKIGETNSTLVAGGNGQGNRLDQLNCPTHIFVDQDHSVYVSDHSNHRVMKWMEGAKEGSVVAGGQGQGNGLTQLNNPRGVFVDQSDTVYVVDCTNNRVMRWYKGVTQGSVVVSVNDSGEQPDQFKSCWGLSADRHGNLYVADYASHSVQKFNIDSSSNA